MDRGTLSIDPMARMRDAPLWLRGLVALGERRHGSFRCVFCGDWMEAVCPDVEKHVLDISACRFLLSDRASELGLTEPAVAEALGDCLVECLRSQLGAHRLPLFGLRCRGGAPARPGSRPAHARGHR